MDTRRDSTGEADLASEDVDLAGVWRSADETPISVVRLYATAETS